MVTLRYEITQFIMKWQRKEYACSFPRFGNNGQIAAMIMDNPLGNGQAEPHTAEIRPGAEERFHYVLDQIGGYADAFVPYAYLHTTRGTVA